jgi:serine/threonine protein kinase
MSNRSYTDPKYIGLIMEPVAESDLLQFLKRDSFRDEELTMLRSFLGCLSSAVVYLHANNCRHKDLKPGNILINNGTVLITDFGIALDWTDLGQDTTTGKPEAYTNSYVAPEVAAAKPRNVAADVWSLGCVFMDITVSKFTTRDHWLG